MKVFISHHIARDERLASVLRDALRNRGIEGYIAQRMQKYEILILDKIKNEIESSDYVVAIITRDGLASASVHEEIGYAIGKDVPVILMVEEEVKEVKGVLIHGKEEYYFTREFFRTEADEIAAYIKNNGISKRRSKPIVKSTITTSRYLKYDPQQKLKHLESDIFSAFEEHGFTKRTLRIFRQTEFREPSEFVVDLVEDKKRFQRYFIFAHNDTITNAKLDQIYFRISNYIFPILRDSDNWLNMSFIATIGGVSKQTIANYYYRPYANGSGAQQNTTIPLNMSMIYYGLGEIGSLQTQRLALWDYSSSMPKFFAHTIKSKDDIVLRIGSMLSFVKDNNGIFKNVPRLVGWSKKYDNYDDAIRMTVRVGSRND